MRTTIADVRLVAAQGVQAFAGQPPGVIVSKDGDLTAPVDQERPRRVLRNLVENALKYALPDSQPVRVSVTGGAGTITVRVTDDGQGIPESDLAQVFVPFFRVDRSRSKQTGGYGLGLSLCQRIDQAHGGTISVAANHPRGAVFTVVLHAVA